MVVIDLPTEDFCSMGLSVEGGDAGCLPQRRWGDPIPPMGSSVEALSGRPTDMVPPMPIMGWMDAFRSSSSRRSCDSSCSRSSSRTAGGRGVGRHGMVALRCGGVTMPMAMVDGLFETHPSVPSPSR